MQSKWVGILSVVILSQLKIALTHEEEDEADFKTSDDKPQVEVRAVFINCEPEVLNVAPESEVTRFQRDELFKHSVLKECSKKLALTVKIKSESGDSGDEYLPIEHVFEGSNEKRVRLLDPYILRLRREVPRQAYVLRRLDTLTCVLTNDVTQEIDEKGVETSRNRIHRDVEYYSEVNEGNQPKPDVFTLQNYFTKFQGTTMMSTVMVAHDLNKSGKNNICPSNNISSSRQKRNERNIVVETVTYDDNTKWVHNDNFYRVSERDRNNHVNEFDEEGIDISNHNSVKPNIKSEAIDSHHAVLKKSPKKITAGSHSIVKTRTMGFTQLESKAEDVDLEEDASPIPTTIKISQNHLSDEKPHSSSKTSYSKKERNLSEEDEQIENSNSLNPITKDYKEYNGTKKGKSLDKKRNYAAHLIYSNAKDYAVYEIGSPELWHTVHVQLFEKLSTPEGKTVWNDLTKGEPASVGSSTPDWTGQDLIVKYRSSRWMPKEDFTLPSDSRLCLLVPINDGHIDSYASPNDSYSTYEDSDYLVVPEEEIQTFNEDSKLTDNNPESENSANLNENNEQNHRRVTIRVSRAVLKGNEDKLNIASQGADKYLLLHHRRPLYAQIDLEARADENQLVRIGASGRISIAASDGTRRTRTVLNLQVGNTGLAAARFRVAARDCYPLLSDLAKNKEVATAGPILIPPRHTRSIHLELPVEIPAEDAHCSVSLINDDGQTVAVRDVSIKKGDRCFCVWHCDCVCLSKFTDTLVLRLIQISKPAALIRYRPTVPTAHMNSWPGVDPKLMCRDMDEVRQKAAGLSMRDRVRHTRSVLCADDVNINIITVLPGVLLILLLMGVSKALMGLMCSCIGIWGMRLILHAPRRIDHYYEKSLRCRCVEYDEEGWPVHPDTKKRTVHVVNIPMEFFLNTIFFICMPGIVLYDVYKAFQSRCDKQKGNSCPATAAQDKDITNEVFSSHDIQEMAPRWRRRRDGLRRWMTPQAQELSTELWQRSLKIRTADNYDFMRPLLRDNRLPENRSRVIHQTPDSCADSEQDDTEYVLSQMQKSRESLARSQKKINNHDPSSHVASNNMDQMKRSDIK